MHEELNLLGWATAWTQDRARDWWATHQPVPAS